VLPASAERPQIIVLGGPNGAGKTTVSRSALAGVLQVSDFVNADTIAAGLAAFNPESVALQAGRLMLARLHELAACRASFAFETTLASRSFAPWLRGLITSGYEVQLLYVWLRSPDLAVARVRARIAKGGHAIPEETIRRRYWRSASNFARLYSPMVNQWRVYDNSRESPRLVAFRAAGEPVTVRAPRIWRALCEAAAATSQDDS
jgi:predicted ABC-type ATPase